MPRPGGNNPSPWIEKLILGYDIEQGTSSSIGRLKAHVIGVGQMSQSQAQGSVGPIGLLILSDGVLQIPAVLTASAWDHLQEQEDRESFSSLVNTTVRIQDYQLQFHMAMELIKCRFFLSVGELATMAAGLVKENTPCCRTVPSIRMKISETWKTLSGQDWQSLQKNQCGFDLSVLLWEWQDDYVQGVLQGVRERLRPVSPQPSTSALTHSDTFTGTSWDVDRVRYKGEKPFSVPIKCLLIPEGDAQQLPSPPKAGGRTPSRPPAASEDGETAQPSVDNTELQIATPAVAHRETSPLPEEHEDMTSHIINSDPKLLDNPWDIFPPPGVTFSSPDASPEASPPNHPAAKAEADRTALLTSMQPPDHSPTGSQQTSEQSKEGHSYFPPYQKPPLSANLATTSGSSTSAAVSSPDLFTRPSDLSPATDKHCTSGVQQDLSALDAEEEIIERRYKKAKRKRSEPTSEEDPSIVEEQAEAAQTSAIPPSWLFETQAASAAGEGSSHTGSLTAPATMRRCPTVHSNGQPFSYTYQVSGHNLQDFSRFKVAESFLLWAVKYLVVPKQTDEPHTVSAAPGMNNLAKL